MAEKAYVAEVSRSASGQVLARRADVPKATKLTGAPRWIDVVRPVSNFWSGTTIIYSEIKSGNNTGSYVKKPLRSQVEADIASQARMNEAVAFERSMGAALRNTGVAFAGAAIAVDAGQSLLAAKMYYDSGDNISAGREVAGFGGRLGSGPINFV